ncbi:MAG: hypothetical protein JWM86_1255 [Thermoleophilia bacterium]|nr:hypothetical protein [Thermoleophilia bacterium]
MDDAPHPTTDEDDAGESRSRIWHGRTRYERARLVAGALVLLFIAVNVFTLVIGAAFILALPVLIGLAALWFWSLRSERAREALLPFEAGAFVLGASLLAGAVVSAVDPPTTTGDFTYVGLWCAAATTVLFAFARPLVRGRRAERPVLIGIVALATLVGVFLLPTFDLIDGDDSGWYSGDETASRSLAARYTEDGGVRLGSGYQFASLQPLSLGYGSECIDAMVCGIAGGPVVGVIDPGMSPYDAVPVAPSDPASVGSTVMSVDPGAVVGPADSAPPVEGNVSLELAPDGDVRLRLAPSLVAGVDAKVSAQVRRGTCQEIGGKVVDAWTLTAAQRSSATDIVLDVGVDAGNLKIGDQLVVVLGVDEPLGVSRCSSLLSPTGIAVAASGGARFGRECVAPLRLPASERIRLTPSSFQSTTCSERFTRLREIATAAIVRGDAALGAYRECMTITDTPVAAPIGLDGTYVAIPAPSTTDVDVLNQHAACVEGGPNSVGAAFASPTPGVAATPLSPGEDASTASAVEGIEVAPGG